MSHPADVDGSLLDPHIQSDPFEFYDQLREKCPVYQMPETGFWVLTTYDDVRAALTDTETFSSQMRTHGMTAQNRGLHQKILKERGWAHVATLQRTDPPDHTRYRKLLNRVFTGRRVRQLEPYIDGVVAELIDGFVDDGRCEFMYDFAVPLPGIVIAEQLGLSRDDIRTFARWADAMLAPSSRFLDEEEAIEVAETELEAQHFFAGVFEDRRASPRDDIISGLVHAHGDDDEPLTVHELQSLMHQLITGGYETTTSALGHGLLQLVDHPDQMARLRADRSLMKAFVEESLRHTSPVQSLSRWTTRDVEINGTVIPEGSTVMVRFGAANRDPDRFECPAQLDLDRDDVHSHVAFGLGNHFCIGAALARYEIEASFTGLLDRLDDIELAEPMDDPAHLPSLFLLPLKPIRLRFSSAA